MRSGTARSSPLTRDAVLQDLRTEYPRTDAPDIGALFMLPYTALLYSPLYFRPCVFDVLSPVRRTAAPYPLLFPKSLMRA